eukprot:XP_028352953.1 RNA/RNP complex-1-interacting phosphatase-like [Physeter catodon]
MGLSVLGTLLNYQTGIPFNSSSCVVLAQKIFLKRILLQKNVFPPWIFFNKLQEQNEELGLIIDLTYTRRYYKPEVPRSTFSHPKNTSSQQCLKFALFPNSNPSSSDSILLFY